MRPTVLSCPKTISTSSRLSNTDSNHSVNSRRRNASTQRIWLTLTMVASLGTVGEIRLVQVSSKAAPSVQHTLAHHNSSNMLKTTPEALQVRIPEVLQKGTQQRAVHRIKMKLYNSLVI